MARNTKNTNATANADEVTVVKSTPKKYEPTDLIQTRSLTQGELLMTGKKSGILYRWGAYGDITEVEYQDLYTLKASRSNYLYKPLFVIEDNELLAESRWSDLKSMYEKLYNNEDMYSVLKLPVNQLARVLKAAPEGYKKAICIEAATRIEDGTFDSMNKIKKIDEICGTDLKSIFK